MQKVVTGQVVNIEPRSNGWSAVHILAPGKQHPVKLSTKKQELLQQAASLAWQHADALYNEEESQNINPHTGTPYLNRYLEGLAPAGTLPQPQQQPEQFGNLQPQLPVQPQGFPQQPIPQAQFPQQPQVTQRVPVSEDERETRIMRQTATKVAAVFLPMLAEEDRHLGSLLRISENLLRYYRQGVGWETEPVSPDGGGGGYAYGDPGPEPGAPAIDEDIPF